MSTSCPSCSTEMKEFETRCPACLRERTRDEIFSAGKTPAAGAASRGRSGGLSWIFVGIGAIALSFYLLSEKKLQDADFAAQRKLTEVESKLKLEERRRQTSEEKERTEAARSEREGTETARSESDEDSIIIISPSSRPKRTAETAEAPLPKNTPSAWLFRGEVYDLISLAPVRGARLTFEDRISGKLFRAKSNSKGRYKIRVPKIDQGGYIVKIRHRNYDGIYLEDISPPYKQRDGDDRLETLQSFSQSTILHVPLLPEESENEIRHDLVLLPR